MTTRDMEALDRCPFCAQLSWECDHSIARYDAESEVLESTLLAFDIRNADRAVAELFESCRRRNVQPTDDFLAGEYQNQLEFWEEAEKWSSNIPLVLGFLETLPGVISTEADSFLILWSTDVEVVRRQLFAWRGRIDVEASRDTEDAVPDYNKSEHQAQAKIRLQQFIDTLNRTVVAEAIVDEMAKRQRKGPYGPSFRWNRATDTFTVRFTESYAKAKATDDFDVNSFVVEFVDSWPEGAGALRLDANWKGELASPPYTINGLWPAFLNSGASGAGQRPVTQENAAEDEDNYTRSLLDQLLSDSRLYTRSSDYKALLDFVVRMRNFAPFNAMLLNVQKPGLSYAASAADWRHRFGRTIKDGARPLLILWPFGPVALVYDVLDTEGSPLPEDVSAFVARGEIDAQMILSFSELTQRKGIFWRWIDAGDNSAGSIEGRSRATDAAEWSSYYLTINQNHSPAVQFATLSHELGHLFLGHLGADRKLKIGPRPKLSVRQREIEAESVAYLVCKRNGVICKSESYLANYVQSHTTVEQMDIYQIMRAAGQVESLLGIGARTRFSGSGDPIRVWS